jgi:hypothetical protein
MKKEILIIYVFTLLLACDDNESAVPDLSVIPSTVEFSHAGSIQKIHIGSNVSWIASSNQDWCVASTFQGLGDNTLDITVPENTTYYERIAYVSIKNRDETVIKTIKVIQKSLGRQMFRRDDSLTLVKLYDLTGGNNWANNIGWKIANLEKWHGIVVNNDRVTGIKFENNNLSGELIPELGDLIMLDTLSLVAETGLTGAIPVSITALPDLRYLNISGTSIAGDIPPQFGDFKALEELILSENLNFTGTIPKELGSLYTLKKLVINNLTAMGNIPAELGNLRRLEYLAIDSCFVMSIPVEMFVLTNLEYLSLNNCKIAASFPANVTLLTSLKHLILSNNYLSGTIPPELANLKLITLHLDNNFLFGNIPDEILNKIDGEQFKVCPQALPFFFTNYSCD